MSAKNDDVSLGLDQLNALFAWWGVPAGSATGEFEAQMMRFKELLATLQKAQSEAYRQQMEALHDTSQRVGATLQAFPHCRKPEEVVAAGSTVVATILEGATRQANAWMEFAQKLQDCYANFNPVSTAEGRDRPSETGPRVEPVKPNSTAAKPIKGAVQAKRDTERNDVPRAADVV